MLPSSRHFSRPRFRITHNDTVSIAILTIDLENLSRSRDIGNFETQNPSILTVSIEQPPSLLPKKIVISVDRRLYISRAPIDFFRDMVYFNSLIIHKKIPENWIEKPVGIGDLAYLPLYIKWYSHP